MQFTYAFPVELMEYEINLGSQLKLNQRGPDHIRDAMNLILDQLLVSPQTRQRTRPLWDYKMAQHSQATPPAPLVYQISPDMIGPCVAMMDTVWSKIVQLRLDKTVSEEYGNQQPELRVERSITGSAILVSLAYERSASLDGDRLPGTGPVTIQYIYPVIAILGTNLDSDVFTLNEIEFAAQFEWSILTQRMYTANDSLTIHYALPKGVPEYWSR